MNDTAKIDRVEIHHYPDGAVEFRIHTEGKLQSCVLDYGDGKVETVEAEKPVSNVVFITEHRFKRGRHRVTIATRLHANMVAARKVIILTTK